MTRIMATAVLIFAGLVAGAQAGTAHRHRRHGVAAAVPPAAPPPRAAFSFYPNEIEGGVSGNLPFNNQIRKLRDPLNANGAGR